MSFVTGLRCRACGATYAPESAYVCAQCFGPLAVTYDSSALAQRVSPREISAGPTTLWRYRALLPIAGEQVVDLQAGWTPLLRAKNLGRALGLDQLYLKNDCVNPTGSFKDRVVAVAASKAVEFGLTTLACASTGNLAGSVAAHAARAGLAAIVFIPADLEVNKIIGAAIHEPTLVAVDGTYDQVNRLCSELADREGWGFVNVNLRPYYAEGSKTLGYEVAEQLGWRLPDQCVVPLASGALFCKIWQGFNEFRDLGWVDGPLPRMNGAQAAGCSPIVRAYERGAREVEPVRPNTIAKSLAIGNPADGYYALDVLARSRGTARAVSDDEIRAGIRLLAETEGVFAETAGGVTVATLKRLAEEGAIRRDEVTVAYITGHGLKTPDAISDGLRPALRIRPNLAAFEQAFDRVAVA